MQPSTEPAIHSRYGHPPSMCLCYAQEPRRQTRCDDCGACQCPTCIEEHSNPGHLRACGQYPQEEEGK
jgi:hypothetical protein